jgi:hypothetical protein
MHSLWRISWQALPGGGAIDVFYSTWPCATLIEGLVKVTLWELREKQ